MRPGRNLLFQNARDVPQLTAGLNHYIRRHRAKVMVDYVHRGERVSPAANDLLQVQVQYFIHEERKPQWIFD